MKSFLTFNCLASLIASLLVSCGGSSLSGGGDTKKEKKTTHGDQNASDPQVVTGAYLACESAPSDKTSGQDAVGCNVMSNNQKVPVSTSLSMKFFSDFKGKHSDSSQSNSKSGYQALFINSAVQTQTTRYVGQMYSGGTMLKEVSCDGSKLPCVAPLNAQELMPLTVPKDGQLSLTSQGRDAFKKAGCTLSPDYYCASDGSIFDGQAVTDHMDSAAKKSCMSDIQSIFSAFTSMVTGGTVDLAKVFGSRIKAGVSSTQLSKSGACVVKKQSSLLVSGTTSGCYVALVQNGGSQNV
ncbi:MAG: hypothetical protein WCO71_08205, partial [Pseudomonadota bacterium]